MQKFKDDKGRIHYRTVKKVAPPRPAPPVNLQLPKHKPHFQQATQDTFPYRFPEF